MPASRRRAAANRVATPSASGCKAWCLTFARRPDIAAFHTTRLRLALRTGTTLERHAEANQWRQITKRLPSRNLKNCRWRFLPDLGPGQPGLFFCRAAASTRAEVTAGQTT